MTKEKSEYYKKLAETRKAFFSEQNKKFHSQTKVVKTETFKNKNSDSIKEAFVQAMKGQR